MWARMRARARSGSEARMASSTPRCSPMAMPGSDEPVYAQPQQGFADHRARDSELFRQLNLGEQAGGLGPFTVGYPLVDALIDRVAERPAGCPLCAWGHKVEFAHWAGHLVRFALVLGSILAGPFQRHKRVDS